ncbi:MAG TPA: DUF3106 domain-containing protein [Burkholderiales bacterium]|nr:DUF3106 domain-containing protein [Burkholderiales bacterium]
MAEEAGLELSKGARRPASLVGLLQRMPRLAVALACALLAASAFAARPANNPAWSALTPPQQQILAPLAGEWDSLDAAGKRTWLGIAKRYPKMTPIGQKRVQTRMKKWAKLTPEQRREARERYRKLSPQKRRELERKWAEYQALPPQERARLGSPPVAPAAKRASRPTVPPAPAADGK